MSDSLWPHGLQHTRILCPLVTPGGCSNSCSLSQWCYITISSSAAPFSSCFQSFPESGSFPMSWLFTSGGQSFGASASASVLPMNTQGWYFLSDWPVWSLAVQVILKSLFQRHHSKASVLQFSAFFMVQLSHLYMITGKKKPQLYLYGPLSAKWCLCFDCVDHNKLENSLKGGSTRSP